MPGEYTNIFVGDLEIKNITVQETYAWSWCGVPMTSTNRKITDIYIKEAEKKLGTKVVLSTVATTIINRSVDDIVSKYARYEGSIFEELPKYVCYSLLTSDWNDQRNDSEDYWGSKLGILWFQNDWPISSLESETIQSVQLIFKTNGAKINICKNMITYLYNIDWRNESEKYSYSF